MKVAKTVKSIYLSVLGASFLSVLLLAPLWFLFNYSAVLYSSVTAAMQIALLYSAGWRAGDKDGRKIPGFYPSTKFAVSVAAWGAVIPLILLTVRFLLPDLFLTDIPGFCGEQEFLSTGIYIDGTMDLIYRLWNFPYFAFLGNRSLVRYLIPIAVQTLAVLVGYKVGCKRKRIFENLSQKLLFREKK